MWRLTKAIFNLWYETIRGAYWKYRTWRTARIIRRMVRKSILSRLAKQTDDEVLKMFDQIMRENSYQCLDCGKMFLYEPGVTYRAYCDLCFRK